jgi:hypothetical protein
VTVPAGLFCDAALRASLFSDAALRAGRVAAALLGWRPAEFWAATPAELRTALGLDLDDDGAPARADLLAQLMEAFPDER